MERDAEPDAKALRAAVLAGQEAAWKVLYARAALPLYRFLHARLQRNEDEAKEVFQQVWLVAVRRIRKFDPGRGTFEHWVLGIAANVLRDRRRVYARRKRLSESQAVAPTASDGSPSDASSRVDVAMTALPLRYQEALREKYAEERTVAEIAVGWGSTPKAVESVLARARAAFREAYLRLKE